MMSLAALSKVFSRRGASMGALRAMSTKATVVVPKPNPDGPILDGYLEFLDQMKAKTEAMETKMEQHEVKWMDANEIDALMNLKATHKKEMQEELETMKEMIQAAHSNFAVDGPDGDCDGHLEDEVEEINHLIEEQAVDMKATHKKEMQEEHETMKVVMQAAHSNFAVDGPDGECDGHLEDEEVEIKHIIDTAKQDPLVVRL